MDKNLRNSLLFGAAVGGLFALGRHTKEKQQLTETQLKDINALEAAFRRLQGIPDNNSLNDWMPLAKIGEKDKQYGEVVAFLDGQIRAQEFGLGLVDSFKAALNLVLSSVFTTERANAKAHQVQSGFSTLSLFPAQMEALVMKRIETLRLVRRSILSLSAEQPDIKPEDKMALSSFTDDLNLLERRVTSILNGVHF